MADEALVLDGLALHESPFVLEQGTRFVAAKKKPRFASNPDTSGEVLIDESEYENSKFELRIRVEPQEDLDAALSKLGELRDKLQKCEKIIGGSPVEWRPAGSGETYTLYALVGEETDLPQVLEGEDSGFYLSKPAPVVKATLTCRPFAYREEREVLAPTEGTGPQQELYVPDIEGDVPAEARLVVTDKVEGGQDRRYLEWGAEQVESEEGNPDLLLEADEDFTVEGFQGELAEGIEGSHSTKVIKVGLTGGRVTVAAATELPHKTPHYGKLRVKAEGEGALFRLAYRTADGEWRRPAGGEWRQPPITEEWCELSMRELGFEEVEQGSQVSEIRVEAKCEEGTVEAYVDTLGLTPTEGGRGEGRGLTTGGTPLSEGPESPGTVEDDNATGTLEWKEPGNAKASDNKYATVQVGEVENELSHYLKATNFGFALPEGAVVVGIAAEVERSWTEGASAPVDNRVRIIKGGVIGETDKALPDDWPKNTDTYQAYGGSTDLWGQTWTYSDINAENFGVAISAKVYFGGNARIDHIRITVYYSTEATNNIICHASQSAEVRHTGPERENEGGTAWAPMPFYRGADFYLPPQGDDELLTRLLVKMRRNDSRTEPDAGLEDAQTVRVLARELFLRPR